MASNKTPLDNNWQETADEIFGDIVVDMQPGATELYNAHKSGQPAPESNRGTYDHADARTQVDHVWHTGEKAVNPLG